MDLPPEITPTIARYLCLDQLACCVLVCRAWNSIFSPALYRRDIRFSHDDTLQVPSLKAASRNAPLFRSLLCAGVVQSNYLSLPGITNLTRLSLSRGALGPVRFPSLYWNSVTALLRRNPCLQELRLGTGLFPPTPTLLDAASETQTQLRDHFWDAAADIPHLKSLILVSTRSQTDSRTHCAGFWRVLSRLELLKLVFCCLTHLQESTSFISSSFSSSSSYSPSLPLSLSPTQKTPPFGFKPRLKELRQMPYLMGTAEALEQLRILSYCTELSRLYWTFAMRQGDDTEGSSFPRAEFLRLIRAQTWPLLRELRLKGVDFDDNEISQILDGLLQQREHNRDSCHNDDQRDTMTLSNNSSNNNNNRSSRGHLVYRSYQASSSMEKFSVSGHGFGFRAIHSLSQHFATLQWVDISGGANRTSHALQSILQSCPGLKGIEGDILRVSDMALGKPWVCLGLTYFGADIVVNSVEVNPSRERTPHHPGQILESEQQLKLGGSAHPTPTMTGHDFVYEQLSRLTILQDLNLHGMYKSLSSNEKDYDESHQRLRLDLDHGLNRLADLKRVQQLFFRRPQNMTMREMDWIQRHWCGLRQISWEMNGSDTAIQQDLADACRQWGVSPVRLS